MQNLAWVRHFGKFLLTIADLGSLEGFGHVYVCCLVAKVFVEAQAPSLNPKTWSAILVAPSAFAFGSISFIAALACPHATVRRVDFEVVNECCCHTPTLWISQTKLCQSPRFCHSK